VQQMNTMQTTTLEYIMILGFCCLLLQLVFCFMCGPVPMHKPGNSTVGQPLLPEIWSAYCSVTVVLIMLGALLWYWRAARKYFFEIECVSENNETFVFRWLYDAASPRTQRAFRTSGKIYHEVVKAIGVFEKKAVDLLFSELLQLRFRGLCDEVDPLSWEYLGTLEPRDGEALVVDFDLDLEPLKKKLLVQSRFTQQEWDDLGIYQLSASHYVGVNIEGSPDVHYYRPSQTAFFETLAQSTPEQDAEVLRRLGAKINALADPPGARLPSSLVECFAARSKKGEVVTAKSQMECEVKQQIRGKLVNDKYRATFVWSEEAQVEALLKVLSDPQSGWTLSACDTNITNAMRPAMLKLYVGLDIWEGDAPAQSGVSGLSASWQASWKKRRCPLEVAVLHEDSLQMMREADLHDVYRMLRINETMRTHLRRTQDEQAAAARASARRLNLSTEAWHAELARARRAFTNGNWAPMWKALGAVCAHFSKRAQAAAEGTAKAKKAACTYEKLSASETFKKTKNAFRKLLAIDSEGDPVPGTEAKYVL